MLKAAGVMPFAGKGASVVDGVKKLEVKEGKVR